MKEKMARFAKSIGLTIWIAAALVLISGFHQVEFRVFEQSYELPCVLWEFEIPENITTYGFPFSWVTIIRGSRVSSWGHADGTFAKTSICSEGFASNLTLCGLACCPLGVIIDQKLWKKQNR